MCADVFQNVTRVAKRREADRDATPIQRDRSVGHAKKPTITPGNAPTKYLR